MCSHSCAVLTNMHGMNGMWPWMAWCWVQGPSDVTVITWMHMPVMQRSLYMLWFNFILGVNFISFCFKLIITHYHTQKQREIKFKTRIKLNHNIHIWFASTCIFRYTNTALNGRLFDLSCRPGIYLPRKIKCQTSFRWDTSASKV